MSDAESDDVSLSDMELTAEELAEAEASMTARKKDKSKSTGDIIIDLDLEGEKSKKVEYKNFKKLF